MCATYVAGVRPASRWSKSMTTDAPETQVVSAWKVACDGGEGALGHPRVWLSLPHETGVAECGYCDKRFIHESFAKAAKS
jgi:uncharacterized Zn-finger protein